MAVDDIFSLQVQVAIGSKELSCNFGYKQTAGDHDPNSTQYLADAYAVAAETVWRNILASDVTMQCIYVLPVSNAIHTPGLHTFPSGIDGQESGEALPAISALVVKFLGTEAQEEKNGRKYLPGMPEARLNNGLFLAAFIDIPVAAWIAVHLAIVAAAGPNNQEWSPVIINRISGGNPIIPPTGNPVSDIIASPVVYQQRRRKTQRTATSP
jgi:hypothetical protein